MPHNDQPVSVEDKQWQAENDARRLASANQMQNDEAE